MTAVIVSLLGIAGVILVYWLGARPSDLPDELTISYSKSQSFQMEKLYGKQGLLMANLYDELKQPDTQALIIVVASALVVGGCLYFARLLDSEHDRQSGDSAKGT